MQAAERHNYRGILLILLALLFLAAHDATAKYLAQRFPLPLLVWARFALHCLLMLVFFGPSRRMRLFSTRSPRTQVTRSLLIVAVSILLLAALRTMPLAETTAIFLVSPFLLALIATRTLGEHVDRKRWLVIAIGFCGALLIARPGGALSAAGILLALAAALCSAIYQMQTRQLSMTEDPFATLFYTALTGTVVLSLSLPWFWPQHLPDAGDAMLIALLGLLGAIGHLLMIFAFRHAPASVLAPFNYVHLLWATLLGWLITLAKLSTASMSTPGRGPASPFTDDCREVEQ